MAKEGRFRVTKKADSKTTTDLSVNAKETNAVSAI